MTILITEISVADVAKLRRLVGIVVQVLTEEHKGERVGATFHIRNENKHVLFNERSGAAEEDDACCFDFFASEKTFRLCDHPEHTLSWQSHNMDIKQYPGAVRFALGLVASLSGYTAEEDEATVLWVGIKMGWITGPEAYDASQISDNTRYADLCKKFNQAESQAA